MIRRFTITSPAFEGKLTLAYTESGVLSGFFNEANLNEAQLAFLATRFPMTLELLGVIQKGSKTMVITETTNVPTFTDFWDAFAYKIGHKAKVEKRYNTLANDDKCKAVDSIPAYEAYLRQHPNMEKLYPETYLSQRRFETDWKANLK